MKPCDLFSGYLMPNGYGQVRREGKLWLAHRWVAHITYGPAEGRVVRHKCDQRACVEPSHLEYGTQGENLIDRRERHRYRKLTRADVEDIKQRIDSGESGVSIARHFNVTPTMICHIKKGRQWQCPM